ncbi:MAG: UDP-N-acetylglucosamine 2-epimerase (non-hydrolyzing) [Kiritimatiellae bacterium]|nr:UDP-N-acetylglucosamine 2-epimerase (non-hydrolyzing) [Kiritimatiellia bacterium]MDW8458679.1 UDP-N-acetylglucosamine 2-epimerase (non-hydrolyzing) [Verrucomicrobiota bacterium]
MKRVLLILGTRPEAIKLAPVFHELKRRDSKFDVRLCVTGQHRQMLDPMLAFFGMRPDVDLRIMRANQSLNPLLSRLIARLDPILAEYKPDWVLVQGDTTTVAAAALAAFHRNIAVGHVEAGLRTGNKRAPFPEEINRRVAGVVADAHFAPTRAAMMNLRREGVPRDQIALVGNTVVDALLFTAELVGSPPPSLPAKIATLPEGRKVILVTGHRRENFGDGLAQICAALKEIEERLLDIEIVYPVHLNPNVRKPVMRELGRCSRIHLLEPVDYPSLVWLLKRAWLVLTDSGGIQEEAPTFGIPCLVMREVTERPEGVRRGVARLVGANRQRIVSEVLRLHRDEAAYRRMARGGNPYGDGLAARRIADWLEKGSCDPFRGGV